MAKTRKLIRKAVKKLPKVTQKMLLQVIDALSNASTEDVVAFNYACEVLIGKAHQEYQVTAKVVE